MHEYVDSTSFHGTPLSENDDQIENISYHDLHNLLWKLRDLDKLGEKRSVEWYKDDIAQKIRKGMFWYMAVTQACPGNTCESEICRIHEDIKIHCRRGQEIVAINNRYVAVDKTMASLLEDLNRFGFKTCQHCAGHEENGSLPYLSFDIDSVDVKIFDGRVSLYVKDREGESQIA